jgi:hypothetical protein
MSEIANRQLDLDATLEGWLRDGYRFSADQVVASALTDVRATRQDRASLFAVDVTVFRLGLVAAAVAILAVGLGLGLGPRVTGGDPSPSPSEVSSPAIPTTGMVLYSNPEDGYELTLPARWTPDEFFSNPSGTMRFGGAHDDSGASSFGALSVSIGSTDGTIYDCAPSLCRPIVATTIDELDAAIANDSVRTATPMITATDVDVTLDGEPARLEYVTFAGGLIEAGPQFHHVFAMHDGRPVVLSFDKYAYGLGQESNDIGWVESLIQGFRFLENPVPSPESNLGPTQTFAPDGAGFALDIPAAWHERLTGDPAIVRVTGAEGGITIRTSNSNGEIPTCLALARCQPRAAGSIEDLIRIVKAEYRVEWGITMSPTISTEPLTLGGAAATRVTVRPPRVMTGPGTSHYVFLIRDGRALILEWTPVFTMAETWNEILASFRFTD